MYGTPCLVLRPRTSSNNIKHVIEEFPTIESETKNIKQLKMSLVKKFQDSLNEDIFIPLMTKRLAANTFGHMTVT